jgi:hypothetical protein
MFARTGIAEPDAVREWPGWLARPLAPSFHLKLGVFDLPDVMPLRLHWLHIRGGLPNSQPAAPALYLHSSIILYALILTCNRSIGRQFHLLTFMNTSPPG